MKVLVLGASGMLGNAMVRVLSEKEDWEVFGTIRSENIKCFFPRKIGDRLIAGCDVENQDTLVTLLNQVSPNIVVNCIGLIKQLANANDPLLAVPLNTLLPHRLARLCKLTGCRLVHISTDCIFSGEKGCYTENDPSDAKDIYGMSKYLGEVHYPHAITLRTSIIGHELQSAHGLIDWFLSQQQKCKGFRRAIFSGLPTVSLAQIIRDVVITHPDLFGLYHVAAKPINKYDLLRLVADIYGKSIEITPDDHLIINRSLNSERFQAATGYVTPDWNDLIQSMHSYHLLS